MECQKDDGLSKVTLETDLRRRNLAGLTPLRSTTSETRPETIIRVL